MYLDELYDDCYKMYGNDIKKLRYDRKLDVNPDSDLQITLEIIKSMCLSKVCSNLQIHMFIK